MEDNWNKIENIYGEYSLDLIHLVEIVPSHFVNEKHEEEVRKFYANHPNPLLSEPIGKFCNKSKFVSSFFNNMNCFIRSEILIYDEKLSIVVLQSRCKYSMISFVCIPIDAAAYSEYDVS
ncbi:unnamed protein product [Rotaria magnacalcarata]|uniref:Uncharacterized protein n=1 Tax=Rotaria magnacalcarata TaxID=392030 RepID=A0A819HDS1_9BILA|nr:unnamed protein product [Rotaria magnacalcarata]CAF3920838.1 unnamed protein product [Rotaria magnacalcarata]